MLSKSEPAFKPEEKKGMLVWGGSSSVGSAAVQSAKLMGFTLYATSSPRHHELVKKLGVKEVFDYKKERVFAVADGSSGSQFAGRPRGALKINAPWIN